MNTNELKLGYLNALLSALLTIFTFAIAMFTPPISGPLCQANCIQYPYLDIASRFPRDYIWMFPAIVVTLLYVILMASVYQYAGENKKVFGINGLSFSIISAILIVVNYFIQISVIQPSLLKGETDGISILTQYNPHGIFIALEEIGYMIMCLSFFCIFPVFSWYEKYERAIRMIFMAGFPLALISLLTFTLIKGIEREYYFEIIVISISWLQLIITGFLLGKLYRRIYIKKSDKT
jgi:hypothetical protein